LELALTDVAVIGGGAVMITVAVAGHPVASVTVTVYVPADKFPAVAAFPIPPDQEYV
jgi:hypothetical protein